MGAAGSVDQKVHLSTAIDALSSALPISSIADLSQGRGHRLPVEGGNPMINQGDVCIVFVTGRVFPQPNQNSLISPIYNKQCVYYQSNIYHNEATYHGGGKTQTGWRVGCTEQSEISFGIVDPAHPDVFIPLVGKKAFNVSSLPPFPIHGKTGIPLSPSQIELASRHEFKLYNSIKPLELQLEEKFIEVGQQIAVLGLLRKSIENNTFTLEPCVISSISPHTMDQQRWNKNAKKAWNSVFATSPALLVTDESKYFYSSRSLSHLPFGFGLSGAKNIEAPPSIGPPGTYGSPPSSNPPPSIGPPSNYGAPPPSIAPPSSYPAAPTVSSPMGYGASAIANADNDNLYNLAGGFNSGPKEVNVPVATPVEHGLGVSSSEVHLGDISAYPTVTDPVATPVHHSASQSTLPIATATSQPQAYNQPVAAQSYSQPSYSQPQPSYGQPQPSYGQPAYGQPQPAYGQPTYGQQQPAMQHGGYSGQPQYQPQYQQQALYNQRPQPSMAYPGQPQVNNRVMAIMVPPGVMPGSFMQFQAPDGRTMQIQLPANYYPGMQIHVPY